MKRNFRYINNLDESINTAEMLIYDEIGEDKINGSQFANEIKYLVDFENVKRINVRINTPGGNVMHGFSIFSAIINAIDKGVEVNTYNDGVAASSGSFILLAGKNVYSKDYARIMIHGVSAEVKNENDKSALSNFGEMIVKVFVNRTGIVSEFITDLMNNGLDNWYDVEEAVKMGFIKAENVEKTGIKLDLPEDMSRKALAVQNKAKQILNNEVKPKKLAMKKVIAKLGLQEAADEDATFTAVSNVIKERDEAKTALTEATNKKLALETENAELKNQLSAVNKASAVTAVENAIKEGKLSPSDDSAKEKLVKQAEADLEGFTNLLSMMPTKASNVLDEIKGGGDKSLISKIENRTLRQLEKEDPKLLAEVRNNFKAEYVKLYNEAYKTNKTEADLY